MPKKLKVIVMFLFYYKRKKQVNQNFGGFTKLSYTSDTREGSMFYDQDQRIIDLTNVPAIKDEPYSGNIDNYTSGIVFELTSTFAIYKPVILASNYIKLKDFFRQIIEKEAEKVILIKK
jgi:hypothetical protein